MATITLKPIRQHTTVAMPTTLTDNDVKVAWPDFDSINAFIYSEEQRIITGPCEWRIDSEDDTILHCTYGADRAQHLGVQRLIVVVEMAGQKSTYDKKAFRFVATTDETLDDGTTVEEETAEVDINVLDVSSSALNGAIAAALAAAKKANAAAGHQPIIQNGTWWVFDADQDAYADTGYSAAGQDGSNGHSPYIQDGTWRTFDDEQGVYVDTGIVAQGKDGHSPYIQDGTWRTFDDEQGVYVDTGVCPEGTPGDPGRDGGILFPHFKIDAAMHLQMSDAGESGNRRFEVNDAGHFIMDI